MHAQKIPVEESVANCFTIEVPEIMSEKLFSQEPPATHVLEPLRGRHYFETNFFGMLENSEISSGVIH